MNDVYFMVDFEQYCPTCKYYKQDEKFDPCNDCLAESANANSYKPVYWKEADKK